MERIGSWTLDRKLGQGGMGVVWEAHDPDGRRCALKLIRAEASDEDTRRRFRREARVLAGFTHPNICQVHEVGEDAGIPFIAMELLGGESLTDHLRQGRLGAHEAVRIALGILAGLEAVHEHGLVHRDLKPSNVFVTPEAVKLLDFGLVRPVIADDMRETGSMLTQAGALLGTPFYMAPEQVLGDAVDLRADLFSLAVMLFEMVAGRRPFRGRTGVEAMHAAVHDQPPALGGSAAAIALDRVVRRGLAKERGDRFDSARAMTTALEAVLATDKHESGVQVVAMNRFIALPFRVLRSDPETDFLAVSLPDAVSASLSDVGSLVVRSSVVASRFAGDAPDLDRLAREAEVDVVLTGTLLRAGTQIRVQARLLEAPSGTLIWTQDVRTVLADVFALEDELVRRIVESLALSITARAHSQLQMDMPRSPRAYESYLRANQAVMSQKDWAVACGLYEQCVAEDPGWAPAWARLGRARRLLAKFQPGTATLAQAREALGRALELDPDQPLARHIHAQLEVESGRTVEALDDLLGLVASRTADPELMAALVQVCRYAGLLGPSVAAFERARRLDPQVPTSLAYTRFMLGDWEGVGAAGDQLNVLAASTLATQGRHEEALSVYATIATSPSPVARHFAAFLSACIRGNKAAAPGAVEHLVSMGFRDPEGVYMAVRGLAWLGDREGAATNLARVVDGGFFCVPGFVNDPWLAPVRGDAAFEAVMERARIRCAEARRVYLARDGERLLGPLGPE